MLEGLDAVDWDHLTHAYGAASDVPDLLRALVDPENAAAKIRSAARANDRDVRAQAIWTLWGNVFHQGMVWQATPRVVPFLVEIVREGPDEVRAWAIRYLHHLALGYPQDRFPALVDPDAYFRQAEEPDPQPDNPDSDVKMAGYARDCFRAVEGALATIAERARDPNDGVADAAIATLGSFRAGASPLREIVAATDGRRQTLALVALAQLDPDAARDRAAAGLRAHAEDRELAVLCAVALVLAGAADADAIAALTAPLEDLTERKNALAGTLGTLVSRTLERVPDEHVDAVVRTLGATLATAEPMTNLTATGVLLRLVFKRSKAPPDASALTATQRAAVEAIAAHGAFELDDHSFGNYVALLRGWGLPRDAAALRAYLDASPA